MSVDRGPVSSALEPRVLYVGSAAIGAASNSGTTLGSMFGAWPDDRLLQVLTLSSAQTSFDQVVVPEWTFPLETAFYRSLSAYRRLRPRRGPAIGGDGLNSSVRPVQGLASGRRLRYEIGTALDLSPVRIPRSLVARIGRFRPTVVHSLLGSTRVMRLARGLAEKFGVPLVPHFMDDWPATLYTHGQLFGLAQGTTARLTRSIIDSAPVLLTIGSDMADEYRSRYGRPCVVVGNSVDPADYEVHSPREPELTLCYVGGLHLGRARILSELANRIESDPALRAWRVDVYCPPSDTATAERLAEATTVVRNRGTVPPRAVPGVVCRAAALLFVEADDPDLLRFTRLSVSTKVPQYLAARRPVLAIGPEGQASIRVLSRSSATVQVSAPRAGELGAALTRLAELVAGHRSAVPQIDPELTHVMVQERLAHALRLDSLNQADRRSHVGPFRRAGGRSGETPQGEDIGDAT